MEHRKLGRTGLDVSAIGLGTEHLEQQRETREDVLRTAADAGVNYVDLLYIEPDYWDTFGPVLRPYRDKLILAAHWGNGSRCDMDYCQRCFDDVLARLGNDYAEVGLMTMVDDEEKWNEWAQESVEHLLRYKEQGRVGYIGMSGHEAAIALKAVNSGLIEVLMFPINLIGHAMFPINLIGHADEENSTLYQACADQGVGLVAMKPYHGGTLFSVNGRPSGITPAQCLAYVLSLPVSTTVPGPKNVEELRATLHYLEATDEEKDYRPVIANIHGYLEGQCVYCHHCLPCPEGIEIGRIIWLVDHAQDGITDELMGWYSSYPAKASACTECGVCMERCPFGVDVISKMGQTVELFES